MLKLSPDDLTIITVTGAPIPATTTTVLDERDITIVAAIAMEQRFTNMGVVGGLVGSFQSPVNLGTVSGPHGVSRTSTKEIVAAVIEAGLAVVRGGSGGQSGDACERENCELDHGCGS
ncbi:hypothetical protein OAory_01075980 [Aspergillus oryzae]|uniref:Uncharacterized protein n=1 Tax=Aspergillus oryzae TaxID=5062 RepID=A0A1S9DPX0_ASPOZ|nr:hypothetical protein OAory_01075980 [Aspergillus oryzae]